MRHQRCNGRVRLQSRWQRRRFGQNAVCRRGLHQARKGNAKSPNRLSALALVKQPVEKRDEATCRQLRRGVQVDRLVMLRQESAGEICERHAEGGLIQSRHKNAACVPVEPGKPWSAAAGRSAESALVNEAETSVGSRPVGDYGPASSAGSLTLLAGCAVPWANKVQHARKTTRGALAGAGATVRTLRGIRSIRHCLGPVPAPKLGGRTRVPAMTSCADSSSWLRSGSVG